MQEPPICPALRGSDPDRLDAAVRAVMARGAIPQGYMGEIKVDRPAVQAWLDQKGPNAWWFAFTSAVQAEYRCITARNEALTAWKTSMGLSIADEFLGGAPS